MNGDWVPEPCSRVTDTESGKAGTVIGVPEGSEEALVRFPLLGDLWVPLDELLPGDDVIGES